MSSKNSQRNDVFLGEQPEAHGKPKGLLDAISEIQQYYVVERSGSTIPEDFFTISGKLAFFEVGFKGGFISGMISALLTPFAIGVVERYIPIFGTYETSLFDRIFAFAIALSFTLGYAFFFANLGKYYIGGITKSAIKNLLGGVVTGATLKMFIAFMGFHFIYFVLLDPHRLADWLLKLSGTLKHETLNGIYLWLLEFRPVFLTSAYFVVFTTVLMIVIPIIGIMKGARKTRKIMHQENAWK